MDAYHGFLYIKGGNNKSRFIFDLDGNLAGIQTAVSDLPLAKAVLVHVKANRIG